MATLCFSYVLGYGSHQEPQEEELLPPNNVHSLVEQMSKAHMESKDNIRQPVTNTDRAKQTFWGGSEEGSGMEKNLWRRLRMEDLM